MKNKTLLYIVIAVVVIGGIAVLATKNGNPPQIATNSDMYCSADGTFTYTMPIQSHRSYCVKVYPNAAPYTANTASPYAFSIVDDQGNTLKDFAVTHTKQMHVIVVRKDLATFSHLHQDFASSNGVFKLTDLIFPTDGEYRIFSDFAPANGMKDSMGMPLTVTSYHDVTVGSGYRPEPIGSEEKTKTFNGYQVTLATHGTPTAGAENMLMFSISQNGKQVTDLEQYLGALGHSVILREGTLDFIHAHPMEMGSQNGTISFMVTFPEAGKYKVFTQFQRGGKVFTTDFVVSVAKGANMPDMSMPGMDHSMH